VGAAEATTIVVPLFNEAGRFHETPFLQLAQSDQLALLMVNDGSTDATGELLAQLARQSDAIAVLDLPTNQGKGEAVRRGLLLAMADGASLVGYYDADASTPPEQMLRLIDALRDDPNLTAVLGARVARLGSEIHRAATRHYAGRVYATLASLALGVDVYDTQCGAKVFRSGPALAQALQVPFPSRWTFDVWLIHRLMQGSDREPPVPREAFLEVPLDAWHDVRGSKMRPGDAVAALLEVTRLIRRRLAEGRARDR
jgi:dolichyl-phosphate beta-glucosyltransferase